MSETSSVNTIARERIDSIASRNGEPDWLKDLRFKAWEAYFRLPMPTNRDEDWRTTQVETLDLSSLQAVDLTNGNGAKTAPFWLQNALAALDAKGGIVAQGVEGIYHEPPESLKKQGVIFCSIKEALKNHSGLIAPYVEGSESTASLDKFSLMNDALFNAGAFLYVPANVVVPETFVTVNNVTLSDKESDKGVAVFPRVIVVLEKHSQATLVNIFASNRSGAKPAAHATSLCNAAVEIYLRDGAHLKYLELQNHDEKMFAVTRCNNEVHRDARLSSLTVGFRGLQLKSDIRTSLRGNGASSDVLGIIFGDKKESFSFNTIQDHNAQSTRSNINFKVVLKDEAQSIYQGIIKVDHSAQKTDAFQSNKNLLLGSSAKADSIPKLEILADDVKCSHGATVGPVDREQVFYLMARGLPAREAEELIVGGFVRQVLESCEIPGAANWIESLISEKIHTSQPSIGKSKKSTGSGKSNTVSGKAKK
ncbi:MAG TPA: Fe-S cluster assembly protein SufD [Oculatellaceae cyanobacterium]